MSAGSQNGKRSIITAIVTGNSTLVQALRFAIVGLKSNVLYYLLYAALTIAGVAPMVAVAVVFSFSIFYAFVFNRRFVFRSRERFHGELLRYVGVYTFALFLNLFLLDLGTRKLGYNHFIVQGVLIVMIAGLIFVALKFFVFRLREQLSEGATETSGER